MASAEHEPIRGSGGRAPSGVQGQSPWSGCQGGEALLKLKKFGHWMSNGAGKFSPFPKCLALQGMNGLTVDFSALRKTSANKNII